MDHHGRLGAFLKMAKKQRPGSPGAIPQMRAFLACEAASVGPGSSRSLFGIFDMIWVDAFPSVFKAFSLYVKLNGGSKKQPVSIEARGPDGRLIPMDLRVDVLMKKN